MGERPSHWTFLFDEIYHFASRLQVRVHRTLVVCSQDGLAEPLSDSSGHNSECRNIQRLTVLPLKSQRVGTM